MKPAAKKSPTGGTSPSINPGADEPVQMAVTLGGAPIQESSKDIEMGGEPIQATAGAGDKSKAGDSSQVVEELEVNGDIPQARFGHTITVVSKAKVVLFGGATGDTGKYSMTGETFMYNILNKAWQKLQGETML